MLQRRQYTCFQEMLGRCHHLIACMEAIHNRCRSLRCSIGAADPKRQRGSPEVIANWAPFFMAGSLRCRYLLLEDLETRDVLMPLVFMKELFDKNYSRRLKNEKLRVVELNSSAGLEAYDTGQVLWRPAFESSKGVKVAVCQALGETEIPQVSHGPTFAASPDLTPLAPC